jgi:hypothetical protein
VPPPSAITKTASGRLMRRSRDWSLRDRRSCTVTATDRARAKTGIRAASRFAVAEWTACRRRPVLGEVAMASALDAFRAQRAAAAVMSVGPQLAARLQSGLNRRVVSNRPKRDDSMRSKKKPIVLLSVTWGSLRASTACWSSCPIDASSASSPLPVSTTTRCGGGRRATAPIRPLPLTATPPV